MSSGYFVASDYAGVEGKDVSMYFGYEQTDANGEWCFVVTELGEETMRVPQSRLGVAPRSDMSEFLLAGIAQWLSRSVTCPVCDGKKVEGT